MNKCDVCSKQINWKQRFAYNIVCLNCNTKYKATLLSRIIFSLLTIAIPLIVATSFFNSSIFIYLILAAVGFAISTFFLRYNKCNNNNNI